MTKFGLICSITGSIVLAVMALVLTVAALMGLVCVLLLWSHHLNFDSLLVKIAIGELIGYIAIGIICAFKLHPLYLVAWGPCFALMFVALIPMACLAYEKSQPKPAQSLNEPDCPA